MQQSPITRPSSLSVPAVLGRLLRLGFAWGAIALGAWMLRKGITGHAYPYASGWVVSGGLVLWFGALLVRGDLRRLLSSEWLGLRGTALDAPGCWLDRSFSMGLVFLPAALLWWYVFEAPNRAIDAPVSLQMCSGARAAVRDCQQATPRGTFPLAAAATILAIYAAIRLFFHWRSGAPRDWTV